MAATDPTPQEEYQPRNEADAFSEDVLGLGGDGPLYPGDVKSNGEDYDPADT